MKNYMFALVAFFFVLNSEANTLTCKVVNQPRENAGLPYDFLAINLQDQNTQLIKRTVDDGGNIKETLNDLITDLKVSKMIPTDRNTCTLNKGYNDSTQRGSFTFTCGIVLVQVAYDLKENTSNYYEGFGSNSKNIKGKDCSLNN